MVLRGAAETRNRPSGVCAMFSRAEWITIACILILICVSDVLGGHLVALIWGAIGMLIIVLVCLTREKPPVREPRNQSPPESNPRQRAA